MHPAGRGWPDSRVGIAVAGVAERVPAALGELEVEFRIGPHAELANGDKFSRAQPCPGEIDRRAQERERECQHHLARDHFPGGGTLARLSLIRPSG